MTSIKEIKQSENKQAGKASGIIIEEIIKWHQNIIEMSGKNIEERKWRNGMA